MEPGPLGSTHRQHCAVHVGARRHRERSGTPRRERIGLLAGDAHQTLGLGVVRLEFGVVERPVVDARTVDGTERAEQVEVFLAEPWQLAIGVHAATADGARQRVDVSGHESVAVGLGAPIGARFDDRVGTEEVAVGELQLVVGVVAERAERRLQRQQVVPPLLQDDHRPARRGERVSGGRPGRTGSDDDRVAVVVGHGSCTSPSVYPRG